MVKGALYSTLIRLANSYGITRSDGILINIVLTNQDLAKFCAAAREHQPHAERPPEERCHFN